MEQRSLTKVKESNTNLVKWCNLPSTALEKIYSFASRADQLNMSLVCRKWSEGFHSPSVWRTFKFALTEKQLFMDKCSVMKFVQKYSSMFRHVEVCYKFTLKQHLMRSWYRRFRAFLAILSTTKLASLTFRHLNSFLGNCDSLTNDKMCETIGNFFGTQHHLKRVEFHHCYFRSDQGYKILTKLIENSKETLKLLVLHKYAICEANGDLDGSNAAINLPNLLGLPSFTTLDTEYYPTFACMFACQSVGDLLKTRQTRNAPKIILNHHDYYERGKSGSLTSSDWMFLKKLYPDLQVEYIFKTHHASLKRIKCFILPNIPITRLDYRIEYQFLSPRQTQIQFLFDHLLSCKTNEHLVSLRLSWSQIIDNLDRVLIPFLQACEKLECLELFIKFPTKSIDLLLESWLKNRPKALKKVLISFLGLNDETEGLYFLNLNKGKMDLLLLAGLKIDVDFTFDL